MNNDLIKRADDILSPGGFTEVNIDNVGKLLDMIRDLRNALAEKDAEISRLRKAVVILPEGAVPEEGDLVSAIEKNVLYEFGNPRVIRIILGNMGFSYSDGQRATVDMLEDTRIIRRNGKPVIYESALSDKTNEEGK